MVALMWDKTGERLYETGVDHGVLFQIDPAGEYVDGVAWNGLTAVTESPSGAEASPQYADNIKYLNLVSPKGQPDIRTPGAACSRDRRHRG